MHREYVLVDQPKLAKRGDERGSADEPDVPRSAPSQLFHERASVARDEPHVRVVAAGGAAREHVGVDQTTATPKANGDYSFSCVSPVPQVEQCVTATATNTATGDTSEFSENEPVVAGP